MKVAILGANGRTGLALIKAFKAAGADSEDKSVELIGVVRDKSKLSEEYLAMLSEVVDGDCTESVTCTRVLRYEPAYIVCAVGAVSHEGVQTTRTDATRVFIEGINSSGSAAKFVCVSSFGAGGSMCQTNFAIRFFLNRLLRQPLADHTTQEKLIQDTLPDKSRWLIVRPTGLKDEDGPRKEYQLSAPPEKIRSSAVGRDDVAYFIVKQVTEELSEEDSYWGKLVTITW